MSLASPDRLMWLLLAIPIVLFYLLRTKLKRQPVSTLLFWDQLFDQKRQRSWWQRLRHWLSLLLQLAFVSLLVSALTDPLWNGQRQEPRQVVIVLDNSASMAAVATASADSPTPAASGQGQTRFELARLRALDILAGLREGDEVALVTAGSSVRVPVGMTDFAPAVRDAIQQLPITDGPSRLLSAVETAKRLTRSPENRQILLISDGCGPGWDTLLQQADVETILVGDAVDNVAITALAVRRSLVDPIGYVAWIEAENFGESAVDVRVTIELGDDLVDVIPAKLEPGQPWSHTVTGASESGGRLRVSLDVDDALAIDNEAFALLPQRPRIPVQLVTEQPSLYLESVLSAIPLVDLTVTDTAPSHAPQGGFLLLHRIVPETLPSGGVFVIDPQSDCEAWTRGREIDQAIIAHQAADSPLLPHVRLMNVLLPAARELIVADDAVPLLTEAGGATLMASRVRGDDRLVVLATTMDDSDLPLRIAFPVMMTNAVNWFLRQTGELQPSLRTGELGEIVVGGDHDQPWAWTDGTGQLAPATLRDDHAIVGPVDRVGWAQLGPRDLLQQATEQVTANRESLIRIAVNLCDRQESDLRPHAAVTERQDELRQTELGRSGWMRLWHRPLWFYLVCLSLGLVTAEWFLYQRRLAG